MAMRAAVRLCRCAPSRANRSFLGVGEKTDALEVYHPDRLGRTYFGHGRCRVFGRKGRRDDRHERSRKHGREILAGGRFDLNDLAKQMQQMRRMGGMGGMMNLLPGMGKIKEQLKR